MLKILYKRYYREVYILYLLFCILFWFLMIYFYQDTIFHDVLLILGSFICLFFIVVIPLSSCNMNGWRDSYGNKECKNKCIIIVNGYLYSLRSKCNHCEYCPYSVHKYQHKIFKHIRIFKNKFLGY